MNKGRAVDLEAHYESFAAKSVNELLTFSPFRELSSSTGDEALIVWVDSQVEGVRCVLQLNLKTKLPAVYMSQAVGFIRTESGIRRLSPDELQDF